MVKRHNHYEAAFEAYLRDRSIAYVAVNEQRRALLGGGSLKSLDFIISQPGGPTWLVDVKGRQFPTAGQYFRNWTTSDEIESMTQWQQLFGGGFSSVLVFAYNVVGDKAPLPEHLLYEFGGAIYGFVAVELDQYESNCKPLSERWNTVTVPTERFRALARPVQDFVYAAGQTA
jgi:hypothetical protein